MGTRLFSPFRKRCAALYYWPNSSPIIETCTELCTAASLKDLISSCSLQPHHNRITSTPRTVSLPLADWLTDHQNARCRVSHFGSRTLVLDWTNCHSFGFESWQRSASGLIKVSGMARMTCRRLYNIDLK